MRMQRVIGTCSKCPPLLQLAPLFFMYIYKSLAAKAHQIDYQTYIVLHECPISRQSYADLLTLTKAHTNA